MEIKQFEDKHLSHFSYAVLSQRQIILIDPSRDTEPYIGFAKAQDAIITGVIETHPHADFVSSHLALHRLTGASIYTSRQAGALYPHLPFDEGNSILLGDVKLKALNTPGHSPDSICIVLEHEGRNKAVFTGDTLFIGDCGRPDLRERAGNIQASREELAKAMYHSLREKLMRLRDDVIVYPAHGAGSLCGKNLSRQSSSSIGEEKVHNWSLQTATDEEFVQQLLADQPFIPLYFEYDVALNREGVADSSSFQDLDHFPVLEPAGYGQLDPHTWVVDTRPTEDYRKEHYPRSIRLGEEGRFETWLGSILAPGEPFYLVGADDAQLKRMINRTAAIGYEKAIKAVYTVRRGTQRDKPLDLRLFTKYRSDYTIIDVRNKAEVKAGKIFEESIAIPLPELRDRINEIPIFKPIVMHCAGGYRSAAAASLLRSLLHDKLPVYDLGEEIKDFQPAMQPSN